MNDHIVSFLKLIIIIIVVVVVVVVVVIIIIFNFLNLLFCKIYSYLQQLIQAFRKNKFIEYHTAT